MAASGLHSALEGHLLSRDNLGGGGGSRGGGPGGGSPPLQSIAEVDWAWPPWCLNQRAGMLEVYVLDEDAGTGAWVGGIAMTRVVDPTGKDAYLHVQYVWDDEEYVEDFPPPRVRKIGQVMTVEDMIRCGQLTPTPKERFPPASSSGGYHPAPSPVAAPRGHELAEVILECIEAEGVDMSRVPKEQRAIALQATNGSLYCKIGREQQPAFFEKLVINKERLTSISRAHFEISWEAPSPAPQLRQLARNKLLVDSRLLNGSEGGPTTIPDGTLLSFCGNNESDARFLGLRVTLRDRSTVESFGPHPAVRATQQQSSNTLPVTSQMQRQPMTAIAGVLECVRASGTNFLDAMPPDVKAIPLEFDKATEIGRSHQARVFEELLKSDPARLSFISRTHCRVRMYRGPAQAHLLEVENLSANVLFVSDQPLAKGDRTSIAEGGTIAFAAAVTGDDTKFLEFMLRRAKLVGT